MRKFLMAAVAGVLIGWMGPALAIVGTSTITVSDGRSPIPNATVRITFKTETGKKISTVRRRTPPSGRVTVDIPDRATSIEITVTARSCDRKSETAGTGPFSRNVSVSLSCARGRSGRTTRTGVPTNVPTSKQDEGAGDGD